MRCPLSEDEDTDTPSLIADMGVNHILTLGLCHLLIVSFLERQSNFCLALQ